jgi:hypothetical protein
MTSSPTRLLAFVLADGPQDPQALDGEDLSLAQATRVRERSGN